MELIKPDHIPIDKEDWIENTTLNNLYYAIEELYEHDQPHQIRLFTNAKYTNTIKNPFTEMLFYIWDYHNYTNPTTDNMPQLPINIRFENLNFKTHSIPYYNSAPLNENKQYIEGKLKIYHIVGGSAVISNMTTETEIKVLSMALQRSNQHRIRVFKRNDREIIIFTNVWTWELYYKIIALLPSLFPDILWEIPEETINAITALTNLNIDKYWTNIMLWFEKHDPVKERIRRQFAQWYTTRTIKRIQQIVLEKTQYEADILNYENNISNRYQQINALNNELFGLELQKSKDSNVLDEIIDYITNNKSIAKYKTYNDYLQLWFETPIKYIDQDALQHNYIRSNHFGEITTALLKEAFIDETLEITTFAAMIYNLNNYSIQKGDNWPNNGNIPNGKLPHPHIMRYNCWGANKGLIQKALGKNDLIGAIEQGIATTYNLNATDATVMRGFIDSLTSSYRNVRCITNLKTGEKLSFVEYSEQYKIKQQQEKEAKLEED